MSHPYPRREDGIHEHCRYTLRKATRPGSLLMVSHSFGLFGGPSLPSRLSPVGLHGDTSGFQVWRLTQSQPQTWTGNCQANFQKSGSHVRKPDEIPHFLTELHWCEAGLIATSRASHKNAAAEKSVLCGPLAGGLSGGWAASPAASAGVTAAAAGPVQGPEEPPHVSEPPASQQPQTQHGHRLIDSTHHSAPTDPGQFTDHVTSVSRRCSKAGICCVGHLSECAAGASFLMQGGRRREVAAPTGQIRRRSDGGSTRDTRAYQSQVKQRPY